MHAYTYDDKLAKSIGWQCSSMQQSVWSESNVCYKFVSLLYIYMHVKQEPVK